MPLRNSTLECKCAMGVIASATSNAVAVAALAEERKLALYGNLVSPEPFFYFFIFLFFYENLCKLQRIHK